MVGLILAIVVLVVDPITNHKSAVVVFVPVLLPVVPWVVAGDEVVLGDWVPPVVFVAPVVAVAFVDPVDPVVLEDVVLVFALARMMWWSPGAALVA